jgi:RimJ/RimL family protein N-acetyltransferase
LTRGASLREISAGFSSRRLRLALFLPRMWLVIACLPRTLPLGVTRKRFLAPEWVFIFGIGGLLKQTASPFPERIETERLILRRWSDGDRDAFAGIWADPDVAAALHPEPGHAERRFAHHLGHWEAHDFGLLAVEERASGDVAGWAGPAHPDFVPELAAEVELGWTLRRPYWGRGLASEAARAALDAALKTLDAERIISLIEPENHRSAAVARRIGMSDTSRLVRSTAGYQMRVFAA